MFVVLVKIDIVKNFAKNYAIYSAMIAIVWLYRIKQSKENVSI